MNNNIILPTNDEIKIIDSFLSKNELKRTSQLDKLNKYINLLLDENDRHNLIGKNTISCIWMRHVIDSIQLVDFINDCDYDIFDLGSGAGFPAIILSIATDKKIIMVEKSPVKALFLKKVCSELKLDFCIVNELIDRNNINNFLEKKTIVTARAFKSIKEILDLVYGSKSIKKVVLLKGEKVYFEIDEYLRSSSNSVLNYNVIKSSYNNSFIVKVEI